MNEKSIDFLRQFIAPFMSGKNFDALIGTLADEDARLDNLTVAVNDQLTISTASDIYLDKKASDLGIARPSELGMEDLAFRNMAIQINANKQITEVIHTILSTFYGDEAVRAFAQSIVSEPYVLQDGMDLTFSLEDGQQLTITFSASDFANITSASAREVCDVITRFLRSNGYTGYALPFQDVETGETYIRLFGSAKGPYSLVQIEGGKAQTVFKFPFVRGTELLVNDTVWEITRTIGSTLRFRWTGSGSAPALDKVFVGDNVLIYGNQFEAAGLAGTYKVTNARPAQAFPSYDSGWFEIEKFDFTGLRSSLPDVVPPVNQPATGWSGVTSYSEGYIVSYAGKYWESLQNSNTSNQPDISPLWWVETSQTGVYYTVTLTQSAYEDLMFFLGRKNTPYAQTRYSLAWEPDRDLLRVYLPATTKVVKRDLIGASHMHALYPAGNMNGTFGSATNVSQKLQIINERTVRFLQNGYDNIAFGGTLIYGLTTVKVEYAARESGYVTVVCSTPHGITGVADAWGRIISNTVINLNLDKYNVDDTANLFNGPYIIDPNAPYALGPEIVTTREKILAGESRTTIFVKGFLPNERGQLWFDLNKDTEEGPVNYFGSQVANAPNIVNIVSISQNGTTVTVITSAPHGAIPGSQVLIGGTTNFNGVKVIDSVPSSTTYTFTKSPPAIITETGVGTTATLVEGVASTVLVDPSYNFKYNHEIGADATKLEDDKAYEPRPDGLDYGPYVTGTADGRIFVEDLIKQITALGIKLDIVIVYPSDIGLGNQGYEKDEDISPHSEAVEVWG